MSYSLGPLKTRGNHLLLYLVIRLILQVHGLCNQFSTLRDEGVLLEAKVT